MLTSWSEVSTPAELSMASVLIAPPAAAGAGVLDAAALGHAEVGAFAHHPGPQLGAVDADRVVGLVAGIGVGLVARLHIGADAAEPQQVDLRPQDRAHQLGRRHPVAPVDAERARISATADRLGVRSKTPPPGEISALS
jgi:hypothetical protein